jgi:hypothetical protein
MSRKPTLSRSASRRSLPTNSFFPRPESSRPLKTTPLKRPANRQSTRSAENVNQPSRSASTNWQRSSRTSPKSPIRAPSKRQSRNSESPFANGSHSTWTRERSQPMKLQSSAVKLQKRSPEKSTRWPVTPSNTTFGVSGSNLMSRRSSRTRVSRGAGGPSTSRALTRTAGESSRRRREITVGPVSSCAGARPADVC